MNLWQFRFVKICHRRSRSTLRAKEFKTNVFGLENPFSKVGILGRTSRGLEVAVLMKPGLKKSDFYSLLL